MKWAFCSMGLDTAMVQTIPQRGHPQGWTLLDCHGPAWLENLPGSWGCADTGQLLPRSPAGLRNSSNWMSAGTNITLGTDQLGELDITSSHLATAAGGLNASREK